MEMLKSFLFAILHGAFALTVLILAQDQSGFISIDCGILENSSYKDETTGIDYVSDENFVDTGVSKSISPEYKTSSLEHQFWNVRSFPEGTKNCYTLNGIQGKDKNLLIRAGFMYGNYDAKGKVPEFDLYLGVNKWTSVKLKDPSTTITFEMIHVTSSNYIYVCLINTGFGTPFISAIELRLLNNNSYITETGSLELFDRFDCGLADGEVIRFPDDVYDRIWSPFNSPDWKQINTSLTIDSLDHNNYQPPAIVMSTAVTPLNNSDSLLFYWVPDDPNTQFYIYMHFAELEANQSREFNIYLNGDYLWYGPFSPTYLYTSTIYNGEGKSRAEFQFSIDNTENSTLPPFLNAFEIYTVKQLLQSQTDQDDFDAIKSIKSMYGVKRNWQGDPCAPQAYLWDGLNCSYDGYDPPRITSLNLSSSGLTGEIAPYISNLTVIQILDLSNNSLTGPVPDFLSQLPFLKVLNLDGNKLSGSVPEELIKKLKNGTLTFSARKNPHLCLSGSCKKKFIVPVVASIGGIFMLLLAAMTVMWSLKRKRPCTNAVKVNVE